MRLKRITIKNHARVPDLDLEVQEHLVLVGPNESGKSSILRTLTALLSDTQAQLYAYFTPDLLSDPTVPLVVEAVLCDIEDEDGVFFPHEITVLDDLSTRQLKIRLEATIDPADADTVSLVRTFPESGHLRGPSRGQLSSLRWRFLPAHRTGASFSADSALRSLVGELELNETTMETFRNPLRLFNSALSKAEELKSLRSGIAAQMSAAMPRPLTQEGVQVRAASDPDEDPLADISLYIGGSTGVQSSTRQSDGVRQVIAMSLHDLAHRNASMLAIDEPEIHLHPASQRTIAGMFLRSSNQKIIATHSPYIVHAFEPRHVVAVTQQGCATMKETKRLNEADKLKAHWWSPQLLEALTAQHVIFVEGVADRVVVERVAHLLQVDLQRLGILVFDLRGADNFPHVYGLLGKTGFDLSWSGLVDKDHEAQWCGAVGGKPHKIINHLIWVSDIDLEEEYCRALGSTAVVDALEEANLSRGTGMMQAARVDRVEDIPTSILAARCRDDKVGAAVAISAALTPTQAASISSIAALLSRWIPQDEE